MTLPQPAAESTGPNAANLEQPRVLVVEDDADIAGVLAEHLGNGFCNVDVVADGVEVSAAH